ncbi:MAG: hypothetical protein WA584_22605 [Pyrinomonadaceae bacterium]
MKHRPIHENLDTSFVNLQALIRYLRRRGFAGKIHVGMSGYEANIYLNEANQLKAVEHDQIAGRIAEGEDALQRILIRSREPGGIVNVYQEIEETEAVAAPQAQITVENLPKAPTIQNIKPISVQLPKPQSPPLEFTNNVEDKARQTNLSPGDWQMLLNLIGELLGTIDKTLAQANLDFAAAFQKARGEISTDYPFLSPASNNFRYDNGKITMSEQVSAKLFTASIMEILQKMLEKLGANPKFSALCNEVKQKINALTQHRKPLYDKFSITKQLEKITGV